MKNQHPLNILLAEDDSNDRFFFEMALKAITIATKLKTVIDGEKLMGYLFKNSENLPDVLFLDLNMPRLNGFECLHQIKSDSKLKYLPVIIYSTSLHEEAADTLFEKGAHMYLRKCDLNELIEILQSVFSLFTESKFARPARKDFIINGVIAT